MRPDGFDEASSHLRIGVLECSLHNIVGKRVAQYLQHFARIEKLLDQHVLGLLRGTAEAFLNDIGTEFLSRKQPNSSLKHMNERFCKYRLVQIQDVLHHIIAEWILDESDCMVGDLTNQPGLLVASGMVNAAL